MHGPDYDALAEAVADSGVRTVVGNLRRGRHVLDDVRLARSGLGSTSRTTTTRSISP